MDAVNTGRSIAGEWLERAAQRHGVRPAAECAGVVASWSQLADQARATARWLEANGIGPGDVVAVWAHNALVWPRWLHALAMRGATLLALNLRATPDELAFQLDDTRAALLVVGPGAEAERVASLAESSSALAGVRVDETGDVTGGLRWEEAKAVGDRTRAAPSRGMPVDPPLAVLYTSGTSGRPKGVALSARAFEASARASQALTPLGPGDRWLVCMPLFHVGGLSILVRSALVAATAVIQPRFDEAAVVQALTHEGITHVSFVASQLARVLDASGDACAPPGLRCVLLGGGPAPEGLIERAWERGWPVSPTYGLTEACSQVATRAADDRARPAAGRLRALPGVETCVRASDGACRRTDAEGEILVRGANLTSGYVGHAAMRSPLDADGWLHTGDIGRLDAEGLLEVLDRRDDLIVSGGENVYPAEVEAVLVEHAAVSEAAVVARRDARYGARPVAYWVRASSGHAATAASLADHVRARLAGYKVPVEFIEQATLPRTAAGKLQRARLRALEEARAGS